ncbi:hypothetical protein BC832DRAFT_562442 [Gaertneriomyces semiglobifer]|nr:hypothetical protein BC832DRAFT_562442 [Gaertneriomyces semiglobifer]
MAQELASYQFQLSQVTEALEKDPENGDLTKLKDDLTELINLYSNLVQQQRQASTSGTEAKKRKAGADESGDGDGGGTASKPFAPLKRWEVGQTVMAKYSADGKFYEAIIETAPDVDSSDGLYSVTFLGYGNSEAVKPSDIKPSKNAAKQSTAVAVPQTTLTKAATQPPPKKKKAHRGERAPSKKEKEQVEKQQAWLAFATGAKGKKKAVAPLKKPSIFATPDDPNARVGVVGSGKPMTNFQQRGKHIFSVDD